MNTDGHCNASPRPPPRPSRKPTWRRWWSSEKPSPPRSPLTLAPRAPRSASRASSPSCYGTASPRRQRRRTPSTARWPDLSSSAPNWTHASCAGTCFWTCTTVTTGGGRRSGQLVAPCRLWGRRKTWRYWVILTYICIFLRLYTVSPCNRQQQHASVRTRTSLDFCAPVSDSPGPDCSRKPLYKKKKQ